MRLIDKLLEIKNENLISFHVPGHKYNPLVLEYLKPFDNILNIDVTEIPGTDDLHAPESCIMASQRAAAQWYKVQRTYYLVNGTTSGIYAMIMSVTKPGDQILFARDCHRAVYDAIFLGHLKGHVIEPEYHEELHIPLGLTPHAVEEAIKAYPEAKALVLTYPNYYGIMSNLKGIVEIAKKNNVLVLVDAAHGAHLVLDSESTSAIEAGADVIVHSSHKSLPVFTQASMLHVNSDQVDLSRLRFMMKLHQTSSPSYLLMTSLDIGMSIMRECGIQRMKTLKSNIRNLRDQLPYFLEQKDLPQAFSLDETKLVLKGLRSNFDPQNVEFQLRKNGLQLEFSNDHVAVFVTSIMNEKADFDYLIKMMEMLKFKCYSGIDKRANAKKLLPKMTISEAIYAEGMFVSLMESEHKISKTYVMPYPPGIPIIIPGEEITLEVIEQLKVWAEQGINVIGYENGMLEVVAL